LICRGLCGSANDLIVWNFCLIDYFLTIFIISWRSLTLILLINLKRLKEKKLQICILTHYCKTVSKNEFIIKMNSKAYIVFLSSTKSLNEFKSSFTRRNILYCKKSLNNFILLTQYFYLEICKSFYRSESWWST
jgi:hypothetical protein